MRASRAKVLASSRSSFFRLSPIKRTFEACATMTSCPNSFINRLTHGECVPVSSATRLCGIAPNTSLRAFGVVLSFCSNTTSPRSSNTQYQLQTIPQIQSHDVFLLRKVPALPLCHSDTLLHSRSPFYCASSALSLGAYIASRLETGILIPSDNVSEEVRV